MSFFKTIAMAANETKKKARPKPERVTKRISMEKWTTINCIELSKLLAIDPNNLTGFNGKQQSLMTDFYGTYKRPMTEDEMDNDEGGPKKKLKGSDAPTRVNPPIWDPSEDTD
jgi:hypothetical protein